VWSRNLKNEAALALFVENDIRKLGIVSWREVGRIRMDEKSNKEVLFKQINQPDATVLQVYYLTLCVAQHVSGASTPIIRSSQLR
jgi:hypothetical protein